jgi:hypothetical protein
MLQMVWQRSHGPDPDQPGPELVECRGTEKQPVPLPGNPIREASKLRVLFPTSPRVPRQVGWNDSHDRLTYRPARTFSKS